MKREIRKVRVWHQGAIYHVMERGIRRQEIFKEKEDYQVFLLQLKKTVEKYNCLIHAYCLMTNHIHLLIETDTYPIGKTIKDLAGGYAIYFNSKYGYRGHLFEDRFKSGLVETDSYFLQSGKYIHLNPIKAGMTEKPEDYPWSSYRSMILLDDDQIVQREKTLGYFLNDVYRYRQFIEDTMHQYMVEEGKIRKQIGEDNEWLPW